MPRAPAEPPSNLQENEMYSHVHDNFEEVIKHEIQHYTSHRKPRAGGISEIVSSFLFSNENQGLNFEVDLQAKPYF